MLGEVADALQAEAADVNERRLLVLAGGASTRFEAAADALAGADIDLDETTLVGPAPGLRCERVEPERAETLLGTTRSAVVLDCHEACHPNVLGRVVGTVDGGGLLVLLVPPLSSWAAQRDGFDESLAVPPETVADVTGHFRTRLIETLREHPGIAIVDLDAGTVVRDGLTDPAPRHTSPPLERPGEPGFPPEAYEACLTQDQIAAVRHLEALRVGPTAVVLEADRGRGKSSAAGLAAASLAARGSNVLVTAPGYRNAAEVLTRARELLASLDALDGTPGPEPRTLHSTSGGQIRFRSPTAVAASLRDSQSGLDSSKSDAVDSDAIDSADVLIVDEAAALPVRVLESFLAVDQVAFATTVHGYEGTGRGFEVRFRDHLDSARHEVTEVTMSEPIRYAEGDPVEVWAFRALLLDARPAAADLVADARPESVTYRELSPRMLLEDENLLREAFGLLVSAHYRTEPADLARLLDAPNLAARALLIDGHVASVALLAREGGLDDGTRRAVYEGDRIRGNMLPDVLMSQLRDEDAGDPVGLRVMRIATHHAARSRGLGSRLLSEIRSEFAPSVDWLGTGFGATPELVDFWRSNGYGTIHLATTRNESSGEYSILLFDPTSEAGEELHETHSRWFAARVLDVLGDALSDMDPDVVRAALRACDERAPLHLSADNWRLVAAASFGPALYSVDPAPFRELAMHYFTSGQSLDLTAREERLLVRKLLQLHPWGAVAGELGYVSPSEAMRSLGTALQPLLEEYGSAAAMDEAARYRE